MEMAVYPVITGQHHMIHDKFKNCVTLTTENSRSIYSLNNEMCNKWNVVVSGSVFLQRKKNLAPLP